MEPERLKTRLSGSLSQMSLTKHQRTKPADVDQLANEIFALLNDENRKQSITDVQLRLAQAATMLVRPTVASESAMQVALRRLPPGQLEVLIPHLAGMTCAEIAAQLEKSEHAVFEDLKSAYVQLRYSPAANDHSCRQTLAD